MISNYIIYDIETVPNESAKDFWEQKNIQPDARLKDPEKVKASIEAKKAEGLSKSALHWYIGQVVGIGLSFNGNQQFLYGSDERELLQELAVFVAGKDAHEFVGKTNERFDRPYLIGRYMAHELIVPNWLKKRHIDVDNFFGYGSQNSQISSLDNYAFGLGMQGKTGKGTDVATWYEQGDWDTMRDYCLQDVSITEELYLRYSRTEMQYV